MTTYQSPADFAMARTDLEDSALLRAEAMGHRMGAFTDDLPGSSNRFAVCRDCDRILHANLSPRRGQRQIAGDALTHRCKRAETKSRP